MSARTEQDYVDLIWERDRARAENAALAVRVAELEGSIRNFFAATSTKQDDRDHYYDAREALEQAVGNGGGDE